MFASARRLPAEIRPIMRLSTALLVGWIAGHLSLWWWVDLPASVWLLCGALTMAVLAWRRPLSVVCLAATTLFLGMSYATWVAGAQLQSRLPSECEGKLMTVDGEIVGLPEPAEPLGVRFRFRPLALQMASCARDKALWQLSWRDSAMPLPGERWRIRVKLKRPHGNLNPGGFDAERWQHAEGVSATGWLRGGQRLARAPPSIDLWRWHIRQHLLGQFPAQADAAGTVLALLTGDRVGISPVAWERYARTGVTHLVAISGVHITLVAWLVGHLFQAVWRRIPRALQYLSALRMGGLAGWLAAAGYVLLAGADVPAQRTLLMLGVIVLMRWLPGQFSGLQIWLTALAVVLLMDPLAVHAVGLWLSFGAVGLLMAAGMPIGEEGGWRAVLRAQWLATWGLLPLSLAIFSRVSWVSLPVNIIAIPLVTFVIVPLSMLGLLCWPWPTVTQIFWQLAVGLMQYLIYFLDWVAALPGAWQALSLPAGSVWGLVLALFLLLMPRAMPGRVWAIFPMAWVIWPLAAVPVGAVRMTLLDVGQGLSVLLQTRHHQLLYDTGPSLGPYADAGSRIIAPALREARISRLDLLIFSHDDLDHTGGGASVLAALPVQQVLGVWPSVIDVPARNTPCVAGQRWHWDGVQFDVLWPYPDIANVGDNNKSCVLRVQAGEHVLLLTGDLEAPGELYLAEKAPAQMLKADLLVLGHHGSKTSSTATFLDAVQPQEVIAAVGYRNRFKHPAKVVVQRLADKDIKGWRSDATGALIYDILPDEPWPVAQRWRIEHSHYWRWPEHDAAGRASLGALDAFP
ncbi:MAG: DNA internalization-related competence protein ComEC/Rec2 [Pseudomonadota bacterium]